jgi:apolipoprotein N-acyltransferase
VRQELPTSSEWVAAGATTLLLTSAFPNFEFSFLAWIALVPLLVAVVRRPSALRALILGWAMGTVFFYTTCYWLTYSMVHYGGLPTVVAYLSLIPPAIVIGIFPGLAMMLVATATKRWGQWATLMAPVFWVALEWVRLGVTGQLWNALGYSQAFHWLLIQPANWGGVYAVGFLIVAINSAIVLVVTKRTPWRFATALSVVTFVIFVIMLSRFLPAERFTSSDVESICVVAVQPNVPMTATKSADELKQLLDRHLSLSISGLQQCSARDARRLVIWPESPMNFTYRSSQSLQQLLTKFSIENRAYVLLNSLEPAPNDGSFNSAILINGNAPISQYDKIRLMPFGEYVPLPQWLPGASLISGIVGEFTPGDKYTLMPVGDYRLGVFICIESAYPWIARRMTTEGADLLVNISNDGYLGPTAVMRQHLANVVFRAVENGRPLMRVTNTGVSAEIDSAGRIHDQTSAFQSDLRVWNYRPMDAATIYSKHGDLFVYICCVLSAVLTCAAVLGTRRSFAR